MASIFALVCPVPVLALIFAICSAQTITTSNPNIGENEFGGEETGNKPDETDFFGSIFGSCKGGRSGRFRPAGMPFGLGGRGSFPFGGSSFSDFFGQQGRAQFPFTGSRFPFTGGFGGVGGRGNRFGPFGWPFRPTGGTLPGFPNGGDDDDDDNSAGLVGPFPTGGTAGGWQGFGLFPTFRPGILPPQPFPGGGQVGGLFPPSGRTGNRGGRPFPPDGGSGNQGTGLFPTFPPGILPPQPFPGGGELGGLFPSSGTTGNQGGRPFPPEGPQPGPRPQPLGPGPHGPHPLPQGDDDDDLVEISGPLLPGPPAGPLPLQPDPNQPLIGGNLGGQGGPSGGRPLPFVPPPPQRPQPVPGIPQPSGGGDDDDLTPEGLFPTFPV